MQQKKASNFKFLLFVLLIIGVIIALYWITKNSIDLITDNEVIGPSPEEIEKTVIPTLSFTGITERQARLFVDKNSNFKKDADEEWCFMCKGFELQVATIVPEVSQKKIDQLKTKSVAIGNEGSIQLDDLYDNNTIWGHMEDRNFIVPFFHYALGDNESDIQIPVLEYTSNLKGVNANISEAYINTKGLHIKVTLVVPAMKANIDQNKSMYLKYYPDSADLTKYTIYKVFKDTAGEANGGTGSYYLSVSNFPFRSDFPTNPVNFEFILF